MAGSLIGYFLALSAPEIPKKSLNRNLYKGDQLKASIIIHDPEELGQYIPIKAVCRKPASTIIESLLVFINLVKMYSGFIPFTTTALIYILLKRLSEIGKKEAEHLFSQGITLLRKRITRICKIHFDFPD